MTIVQKNRKQKKWNNCLKLRKKRRSKRSDVLIIIFVFDHKSRRLKSFFWGSFFDFYFGFSVLVPKSPNQSTSADFFGLSSFPKSLKALNYQHNYSLSFFPIDILIFSPFFNEKSTLFQNYFCKAAELDSLSKYNVTVFFCL